MSNGRSGRESRPQAAGLREGGNPWLLRLERAGKGYRAVALAEVIGRNGILAARARTITGAGPQSPGTAWPGGVA